MAAQTSAVHVILNNNAEDYAPRNAAQLRKILQPDFQSPVHPTQRQLI